MLGWIQAKMEIGLCMVSYPSEAAFHEEQQEEKVEKLHSAIGKINLKSTIFYISSLHIFIYNYLVIGYHVNKMSSP